jgi:hypothetical protein
LLSFRELARRLVQDPDFPPVIEVGRSKAVDWRLAAPYFRNRNVRQGQRTDLLRRREAEGGGSGG